MEDTLTEDLLREVVEGQAKELKQLRLMAAAMANLPPAAVNFKPSDLTVQPSDVVVIAAKKWNFHWVKSDPDGNILYTYDCTATPTL